MLAAKSRSTDLALVHPGGFRSVLRAHLEDWRRASSRTAGDPRAGLRRTLPAHGEFYLAYCEGGFLERTIGVAHLLMAKPGYRGDSYLP